MKKGRKPVAFGNRCTRCGGYLDECGVCQCFDHELGISLVPDEIFYKEKTKDTRDKKIFSLEYKEVSTKKEGRRVCSVCGGKPCICGALKGTGISLN